MKAPKRQGGLWVRHDFLYNRSIEFFRDCDVRFLDRVATCLETKLYVPEDVIVEEGTVGESLNILYKGTVSVSVRGLKVAELRDGSCFGEIAVLGVSTLRVATVRALTICDIRSLTRQIFLRLIKEFPWEKRRFRQMALERSAMTKGTTEIESRRNNSVRQELRRSIDMEKATVLGGVRLALARCVGGSVSKPR